MPAERPSGTGHDTARPVPEWVTLKAVASIIRHAAAGAENNKGGLTECSAAALNSWAEVIERNLPVSADPVASPADTIRRYIEKSEARARGLVGPEDSADARAALDALLAVGERDKAEASAHTSLRVELARIFGPVKPREGQTWNAAMLKRIADVLAAEEDSREQDRQHIAQLTESATLLADNTASYLNLERVGKRNYPDSLMLAVDQLRAVLAGEEDADG